jgi:hypothetical protein
MSYFIVEGSAAPGPGPHRIWANAFPTREAAGIAALQLVPDGAYVILEAEDLRAVWEHLKRSPSRHLHLPAEPTTAAALLTADRS